MHGLLSARFKDIEDANKKKHTDIVSSLQALEDNCIHTGLESNTQLVCSCPWPRNSLTLEHILISAHY